MIIKDFGLENQPVLVMIHGGGLSWWSWKAQIEALKSDFSIKAVIIDGHGDDYQSEFVSIEDSAQKIIDYIKKNQICPIYGICGLSIGAQILVEILTQEPEIAENWLIESALVKPIGVADKIVEPMISLMYPLIKKEWFAKIQSKALCISKSDFNDYYNDSKKMSMRSLKQITLSNGHYKLKKSKWTTDQNVLIFVGSKEPRIMIESAEELARAIPGSRLEIKKGYKHGELSLVHKDVYVEIIRKQFRKQT
jgi:pimeloyl-ACP methyl ester carboxylesterase